MKPLKGSLIEFRWGFFGGVEVECGKSWSFSISPFSVDTKKDRNNISCHPVLTHARHAPSFQKPSHSNWWSSCWPWAAFQEQLKCLGMCLGGKIFLWPLFKWSCYSFTNISNYQHNNQNTGITYLRKGSRGQGDFIKARGGKLGANDNWEKGWTWWFWS